VKRIRRYANLYLLILLVAISISSGVLVLFYGSVNVEYPYNQAVQTYRDQAFRSQTFEAVRTNLILMENGMRSLGLTSNMCDLTFSWQCTSIHKMAYEYQLVDTFINRTTYYINFYRGNVSAQTGTQFLSYSDQLHQLQNAFMQDPSSGLCYGYMSSPCIDSIAHNAYVLNFHFYYAWSGVFFGIFLAIEAIGFIGLYAYEEGREQSEYESRRRY
jgi:hypothetical protein